MVESFRVWLFRRPMVALGSSSADGTTTVLAVYATIPSPSRALNISIAGVFEPLLMYLRRFVVACKVMSDKVSRCRTRSVNVAVVSLPPLLPPMPLPLPCFAAALQAA